MSHVVLARRTGLALLTLGLVAAPPTTWPQETPPSGEQGAVLVIMEENDLVVQTDRHYTQGLKFSYLLPDRSAPRWLRNVSQALPPPGLKAVHDKPGFVFGQSIFTPADNRSTELIINDRPYAGWLYGGATLQRRGKIGGDWLGMESLELDLGIIGPESLAQEAQTWVHQIRGFDIFYGWDNQLKTEPGVALRYVWSARYCPSDRAWFDLIPHAGFSLGNVETAGRIGAQIRLGVNLPGDSGVRTISSLSLPSGGPMGPGKQFGWYVFGEAEGWAVGYTVFLDGNIFRPSHSVQKEPLVAEFKTGVVFAFSAVEVGAAYVYRTREFETQEQDNSYGSLFVKVKF